MSSMLYMCSLQNYILDKPLNGIVEADETYIGGKTTQSRKNDNKTIVAGIIERGGRITAKTVEHASIKELMVIFTTMFLKKQQYIPMNMFLIKVLNMFINNMKLLRMEKENMFVGMFIQTTSNLFGLCLNVVS